MNTADRPMILSSALMHGLGMHLGAWMARDGEASDYLSPDFYEESPAPPRPGNRALFLAERIANRERADLGVTIASVVARRLRPEGAVPPQ